MNLDFTQAIEIAKNIYWVGMYLKNDPFQCHPYFIKNGDASILVDPGSMIEFDAVVKKSYEKLPILTPRLTININIHQVLHPHAIHHQQLHTFQTPTSYRVVYR